MPVEFVTIEDVEIVSTGTYVLASGPATFTEEDLADAVAAAADATVPAPRIKIGHTDPRFDEAVAAGQLDGEPAFGALANLRLSDDRQTVVADLVNVPEWLAASMPSAYPGRSIEGGFGYEAPSGRNYSLVISALALLGVEWPGVTSLDDLQTILDQNGAAPADAEAALVTAAGGTLSRMTNVEVSAGLDVDLVRRRFVDALDTGEYAVPEGAAPGFTWWPRSLRFEDDGTPVLIAEDGEGNLFRVSFTVDGSDVTFEAATAVVEQYVPVAAAAGNSTPRAVIAAAWPTLAAARPPTTDDREVDTPMTDEQRRALALALGQPEDTPEARLHEIATARAAEHAETPPPDGGDGEPAPEPTPGDGGAVTPPAIPEGMSLVDEQTLATMREGAEQGAAVAARLAREDRDRAIVAAIGQGRIPVSRREHYETMWGRDPEGTRTLLTAAVEAGGLAPGLVPVGEAVGRNGDGDGDPSVDEANHDEFMARHFPQDHARLTARGDRGRVRVRTEA